MDKINIMIQNIIANPNPEFLIKSISEQGYSLETALADLIDNSITADATRIDIITYVKDNRYSLFIADNGNGMNNSELEKSMMFPSSNMDTNRERKDLGRFGLGLKTASFSQTRRFTVMSKLKNNKDVSLSQYRMHLNRYTHFRRCSER
jgi:DNA topoisomerase VI subunit B